MFRHKKKWLFYILCVVAVLMSSTAYLSVPKMEDGKMAVTFIDVGQGDSILFWAPDGQTLLVDGGEYEAFDSHLYPFLKANNIDRLDYALVTHYHSDHMGGIFRLVKEGMVKTLIIPDYSAYSKTKLLTAARKTDTDILQISTGDTLPQFHKDIYIEAIHPPKNHADENQNNCSLVLKAKCFDTTILLTGDIEADAERSLVKNHSLETDILKVSHHGSSTSSTKEFIEAADPTYGIIQSGKDNRYGHPHYETLDTLSDNDVLVYRTDQEGSISFSIDETGIQSIKRLKGGLSDGN